MKTKIIISLIIFVLVSNVVYAAQLILYPLADTYVSTSNSSANFANDANLLLSYGGSNRIYLKFDVTALRNNNSIITNARIYLYSNNYGDQPNIHSLHFSKNGSWIETATTFENQLCGNRTVGPSVPLNTTLCPQIKPIFQPALSPSFPGYTNYSVEGSYNDTVYNSSSSNYTLILGFLNDGGDSANFDSSEGTNKPYLNITYDDTNTRFDAFEFFNQTKAVHNFSIDISNGTAIVFSTSTTKGNISLLLTPAVWYVNISSNGYAKQNKTIVVTPSGIGRNETFFLYPANSLNFTIYDEVKGKPAPLIGNGMVVQLVSSSYSDNITVNNGTGYIDNLAVGNYRINYVLTGYKARDYYFTITNQTHNSINLYLLNNSLATDVSFTVEDGSSTPLENALISLKRYYPTSNSYITVAQAKTDFQGQSILDVDFDDAFYQVFANYGSNFVNTAGSKIFQTTITIALNLIPSAFDQLDIQNTIFTSLSFNNASQAFSYVFADAGGMNRNGTLQIYAGTTPVCFNSVVSSSATIMCTYNVNESTDNILAVGKINSLSSSQSFTTDTLEYSGQLTRQIIGKDLFGSNGLYASLLFAGTVTGLAVASPAIAVIMFIVGLAVMVFVGFSIINLSLYLTIFILGMMVVWRLRG